MLQEMRNQNYDARLPELGCIDCALGDHIDKLLGGRYLGDVASMEVTRIEEVESGSGAVAVSVEEQVSPHTKPDS